MLITDEIKENIAQLATKYGLDLVVLFGSQARGVIHSKSDIDVAYLGEGKIDDIKLGMDFYELFRRIEQKFADSIAGSALLRNEITHNYDKRQRSVIIADMKKYIEIYKEYAKILVEKFVKNTN